MDNMLVLDSLSRQTCDTDVEPLLEKCVVEGSSPKLDKINRILLYLTRKKDAEAERMYEHSLALAEFEETRTDALKRKAQAHKDVEDASSAIKQTRAKLLRMVV